MRSYSVHHMAFSSIPKILLVEIPKMSPDIAKFLKGQNQPPSSIKTIVVGNKKMSSDTCLHFK